MGVAPSHLGLLSKFAARRSLGESNLDQRAAKSRSPNGEWSSTLPSPRRSTQLIHATRSFHAANAAICRHRDGFVVTARAVNYVLSPDGYHNKKDADQPYRS